MKNSYTITRPAREGEKIMTRDEFFKAYESHIGDNPKKIALRDGYEMHYPNGDIYKFQQKLKPGRTPSRWSGSFFADDFEYTCTWNGELITPSPHRRGNQA